MKSDFPLSPKYVDFINTTKNVTADFLEGTTASGKTTVGAGVKFMRMVSESPKKMHLIAAESVGKAEQTIINKDCGILDLHADAEYYGNGDKDNKISHIKFEDKIIYVLGYGDVAKWKKILGAQFGCVMIDEINIANIEFVREISTRNDYMLATLNPDTLTLPVYTEFVNRSRPYKKYIDDIPPSILSELKEEPEPGWRYWFFSFNDNWSMTAEEIEKKKSSAPKGTKLYKNKILGLRGKATGIVFVNFDRARHVISKRQLAEDVKNDRVKFIQFSAGLDTSYSSQSLDTIAMLFVGITDKHKAIVLDEKVYNNRDLSVPIAPSDTAKNFIDFLERNRCEWGLSRTAFIDSADQATKTEIGKYKRSNPCVYTIENAHKKVTNIDRINMQLGWLHSDDYLVCDTCRNHIAELETYSWREDKDNEPEDANDHTINASQYAWLPYRDKIGIKESRNELE